jgi:hypothetical protein
LGLKSVKSSVLIKIKIITGSDYFYGRNYHFLLNGKVLEKKQIILIIILISLFFSQCDPRRGKEVSCPEEPCWENLVVSHLRRYPELQLEDLYKLLYQATLGNGHAIADSAEVAEWLNKDLADSVQNTFEIMIDTLGSCGRFARIHLYAYVKSGRKPENIIRTFMKTGAEYPPDSDAFFCALSVVRKMSANGKLPWETSGTSRFLMEQAKNNYPAVHHSAKFNSKYHPHYRVIAVGLIPELLSGSIWKDSGNDVDSVVSSDVDSGQEPFIQSSQNSGC